MHEIFNKTSKIQRTPPPTRKFQSTQMNPNDSQLEMSSTSTTSTQQTVCSPLSPKQKIPLTPQLLPHSEQFQGSNVQNVPMPSTSTTIDNEEWTMANKRGRVTSPLSPNTKRKQMKINDYWLAQPVPLSTRFNSLPEEAEELPQASQATKKILAPPIFVSGVEAIIPLTDLLKELANDNYDLKVIGSSQVKIQLKDVETYPVVVKALAERKTEFHSFQAKSNKTYQVVIRNLHPSINTDDLKSELTELGHDVVNISNIRQSGTKKPLPLFKVELRMSEKNKEVHSISRLMHSVVQVEKPHVKREVVQCITCQRYGHTKSYCNHRPRCVKCAGEHLTNKCETKVWGTNVKCVLCNGSHPANYRGCTVYKEVQSRRFPPLREKTVEKSLPGSNPNPSYQLVTGTTYAQKLKNSIEIETEEGNRTKVNHSMDNSKNQEQQPEQSSTQRLEIMMEKLMTKMDTILNLLTTIVSKSFNVQNP